MDVINRRADKRDAMEQFPATDFHLNLTGACLQGANLREARLEGADLGDARLEGADLWGARLEGAILSQARLEGAILWGARLEGAHLSQARLEGADLRQARLEGADLSQARLEGADLSATDFRNSNWAGVSNRASPAQFADFRGAQDLFQGQLETVIGNSGTLLPDYPDANGQEYSVASCWDVPPPDFEDLLAKALRFGGSRADLLDEWLCGREPPARVGTRLPVDAPYPPGHPLAP
jgi:hypothetical protein